MGTAINKRVNSAQRTLARIFFSLDSDFARRNLLLLSQTTMDVAWACVEGRCHLGYLSELVNNIFFETRERTNIYLFLHNLLTIVNAILRFQPSTWPHLRFTSQSSAYVNLSCYLVQVGNRGIKRLDNWEIRKLVK